MSLPHAILAELLARPASGFDLTRRLDRSTRPFWPASHQQIYQELKKLEADGLIAAMDDPRPPKGGRKMYEVCPAGVDELRRWAAKVEDPRPVRDPLMIRLRAAAILGDIDLRTELLRHLDVRRSELSRYADLEQRYFSSGDGSLSEFLQHQVLRAGVGLETFWAGWLAETLEELEHRQGEGI